MPSTVRNPIPRLVAITPGDLVEEDLPRLRAALLPALRAGLPGVLLREPRLQDRAFLALARVLRELVGEGWLALHDRPHLAEEVGADAVHLGSGSLPAHRVRATFGARFALGLSTHAGDDPDGWRACDYVFHGPVRAPASKPLGSPARRAPIGFDGLALVTSVAPCPVLALGGLRPEDGAAVRAAGGHGLAVLTGILSASDPARATRDYLEQLP